MLIFATLSLSYQFLNTITVFRKDRLQGSKRTLQSLRPSRRNEKASPLSCNWCVHMLELFTKIAPTNGSTRAASTCEEIVLGTVGQKVSFTLTRMLIGPIAPEREANRRVCY